MLEAKLFLNIIKSSANNFRTANSLTQLNLQFVEAIDEALQGSTFGIFSYNDSEGVIKVLSESYNTLESMGMEGEDALIIKAISRKSPSSTTIKGFTLIPLFSGSYVTGAILIKRALKEEEQFAVEHLSQLWVQSKDQMELESNNIKLAKELGRSVHNLSVVRSIANAVSKAQDLNHLLSLILRVAITTVNASRGFIMLENENTRCLELKVVLGLPNKDAEEKLNSGLIQAASIPPGEGIQGRVMESQEPVILSELRVEEEPFPGMDDRANSLMCVPLVMNDTSFGVIYVTNGDDSDSFDKEDLDVLCILASHASAVLDQTRLYNLASTDELTGLYTRRYYSQRIGDEFKRAVRYKRTLSLMVMDIDHFKNVNDTHGHLAGDYILKGVAREIKSHIRTDLDTAVRFGGEEFVLILPETPIKGAFVVADRIREAIEKIVFNFDDNSIKVTISIGASCYPENESAIEELFNHADRALYSSKTNGRNRVTTFPELT